MGQQALSSYANLLEDVKARIRAAQVRASLSVNRELIQLYWDIGQQIVRRQAEEGWGRSVVPRLAGNLQAAFPGIAGFSPGNIWKMRAFYLAYTRGAANLLRPVTEMPRRKEGLAVDMPAELDGQNLPPAVAEIPWGHNITILKLRDPLQRLWYARKTVEHGWSRNVLSMQIDSDLYSRQGKAITNFASTLPAPQSDLAGELLKDPYTFDFLALGPQTSEQQLHRSLLAHLKDFLVELGKGFAFVGSQYGLQVGGQDYYLDLLFYHLRLRCFVVIELKVEAFRPEFAGKMNFYLSAVDEQIRHSQDAPSIGLILCRDHDRIVVEYALRDSNRPMGVASYRLTRSLPRSLRGSLPTARQLEAELQKTQDGCDEA